MFLQLSRSGKTLGCKQLQLARGAQNSSRVVCQWNRKCLETESSTFRIRIEFFMAVLSFASLLSFEFSVSIIPKGQNCGMLFTTVCTATEPSVVEKG